MTIVVRGAPGFLLQWSVVNSGATTPWHLQVLQFAPLGFVAHLSLLISILLLEIRLQEEITYLVGSFFVRTPPSYQTSCYWVFSLPASCLTERPSTFRHDSLLDFSTEFFKICQSVPLFSQDSYQLGLRVQLDVFQGSSELQLQCIFFCVCLH